ncbi:MAG TPA: hypothetical protein VFW83_10520 [Bryobacteraceae bacterium]|nr:hypothetical protein [Bryobacteraceae bacterium]
MNSVYSLPFQGNRAIAGWQVSGIFTANSGEPFTVGAGFDQAGLQNSRARPDYVPGCEVMVKKLNEWYNPACFQLQPVGEMGTEGRNVFSNPDAWNLDFALLKNTKITEELGVQFRAEFFNIFNHPNWGPPSTGNFVQVPFTGGGNINALAGTINSASVPRQIQFALKFTF